MLKQFVLGAGVLALLAGPALAQAYVPSAGSGNTVQGPGGPPVRAGTPAYVGHSGEAYRYRHVYGRADCRTVVRHEWRHGHRITFRRRDCR